MTLWSKFKFNFANIINDIPEYKKNFDFLVNYNQNVILYSYYGFPFDLFIDEIIKKKFNLTTIYRKELLWNKIIIYNENQYFFEIDLNNPNINKKLVDLNEMLLFIIKTRSITNNKHLIIIKNIDKLSDDEQKRQLELQKTILAWFGGIPLTSYPHRRDIFTDASTASVPAFIIRTL